MYRNTVGKNQHGNLEVEEGEEGAEVNEKDEGVNEVDEMGSAKLDACDITKQGPHAQKFTTESETRFS